MGILAIFLAAFALVFFTYKKRGQKTADCIHKGLVAGILASVIGFGVVTGLSYL